MRFRLIDAFRVAGRSVLALTLLAIGTLAVPALVHDKPAAAATDWGKALVELDHGTLP